MQRVTSAEALSSSAGQANTTNPTPIHGLLPHVSELYDGASETDDADDDARDDVPLLQHNSQSNQQPKHTFDVSASEIQHNEPHTSTAWREAVASLKLAAPVTVQAISQFGHILVIMSAVGHIGVDELAAVAVGWTWFNLVRCFCFGLSGAYDTLGSQAYGAGNKVLVMSWAITAIFSLLLVNIPVSVGMWYAGDAARVLFQQEPNVCQKTATFCRFMIPGLFPWSLVTILMKFLQVQGQMWAPALCTVAAMMIHVPGTLLLVHYLGFAGAGWAVVVMRTAHLSFTILYLLTLGRRYSRFEEAGEDPSAGSNKVDDEEHGEERHKGAPLLQPQKGDSASSLRGAYSKGSRDNEPDGSLTVSTSTEQSEDNDNSGESWRQTQVHSAQREGEELLQDNGQLLGLLQHGQPNQQFQLQESDGSQQSQDQQLNQDVSAYIPQHRQQSEHLHQVPFSDEQQQAPQMQPVSAQIQQAVGLDKEASEVSLMQSDGTWSLKQIVLFSLLPSRLWAFLGLGIPGGLASSVQSAAGEVTTAMAGVLGTIQIDAHTTMLSVSDILFTLLGFGFAVGCTIRVGQLLGSQRPAQAKLAATVTMSLGFSAACMVGLNMYLLSNTLGRAFTNDSQVLQTVNHLAPLLALYSVFNGSSSILAGALKGMGRQSQLMWVGIAGFWGCGVPLGYTLAFPTKFGISGLWLGALAGSLIVVTANLIMLLRVDWTHEAQKAAQKQQKRQMR